MGSTHYLLQDTSFPGPGVRYACTCNHWAAMCPSYGDGTTTWIELGPDLVRRHAYHVRESNRMLDALLNAAV